MKKQGGPSYLKHAKKQPENNSYKCEKCRDMLFILQGDGSAKECECRQLRIAQEKLKASGISEEFRNKKFENYKYDKSTETMEAFLTAKNYTKEFEDIRVACRKSCLLSGQVGSGKTHLGMAIANNLLDKSIGVIYMPYRSIITNLKQSITDEYNYQSEIKKYKNAQVLLIDDLFKGRITESDINIIYEIVDYRYFKNLPMIVTTEKTIENLLDIDEAIGSRIYEMSKDYVVTIQGKELNYRVYGR